MWLILLLAFMPYTYGDHDDICKKITMFDAVCKQDNIIYILSASPCISNNTIGITIINTDTLTLVHNVTQSDIKTPIPIDGKPGKGVILEMHPRPVSKVEDYRKATLHVLLYLVDVYSYMKESSKGAKILDVEFYMFFRQCNYEGPKDLQFGFNPQSVCNQSVRTGEYLTVCLITNSSFVEKGAYMIGFGMCTVPYSVTVLAFTQSGVHLKQTFTQDKTDVFMPLSKTNCGLKMDMHVHDVEFYHVALLYGCEDKNVTLIDDEYASELGMICPLSNCTALSTLSKRCFVPWIYKQGETRLAEMNITLNVCKPTVEVSFTIYVHDEITRNFIYTQNIQLIADHEDDWHESDHAKRLYLNHPDYGKTKVIRPNDGYLYLDNGNISLYVHEEKRLGFVHTAVLRHYPKASDGLPLLHAEFWVQRKNVCPAKSGKSLKIGLSIAGVALVVLLAVIIFYFYKRRQRSRGVGLPFKIHLDDEEEMEDLKY